ncbi:MAG: DNA translocase FtsK [Patescibacteria group bacterium]|nr:DNA translocase FtsK [Patescibacteria group bacterium]
MKRRRSRRSFKGKLKKKTVYTIISVLLLTVAGLIFISYFQEGEYLGQIRDLVQTFVGWTGVFFSLVLLSYSLLLLGIKTRFTRINVPIGLSIVYGSIISITQSGEIGYRIWQALSETLSVPGGVLLVFAFLVIGFIVLFNTSLDELVELLIKFGSGTGELFQGVLSGKKDKEKKPIFVGAEEKQPIKPPDFNPDTLAQNRKAKTTQPVVPSLAGKTSLGSELLSNPPAGKEVPIWEYPPNSLLVDTGSMKADRGNLKRNAQIIEQTLDSFGISARVSEVNMGPAVTQYALEIAMGTKVSKITSLANDLALALAAPTGQIRIEAPIPGRSLVGIEIPNRSLELVTLRKMLESDTLGKAKSKLTVALGLDVSGQPKVVDLAKMPHVLIAGTTGSGKSVLINSWICSVLFRTTPQEVRLILVDPKRVELTGYNGIPHLLTPVIVEIDQILSALKWSLSEMDRRYKLFAEVGVRNIDGYNELSGFQALPFIVIIIDELADLMAYSPVEVEDAITRLAQMARAVGIHLVLSTQRPSVDVITGLIKANIPARIAFNVSSMIDSRVIIDMPGAEKLLGRGDMLFIPPDQAKPVRIQGAFVTEHEVRKVVEYLKSKEAPVEYTSEVTSMPVSSKIGPLGAEGESKDDFFDEAIKVVCQYDRASASLLQRRLRVGYARAARMLDQLEREGIVGPSEGSKPREVLIRNADEYFAQRETQATTQS